MVGFWQSPAVEGEPEEEEEKGGVKVELALDSKQQLPTTNELLGPCLPELEESSLSFINSFLNFDYIDGWLAEGDSDLCKSMDGLGDSKGDFEVGAGECKEDGIGGALGAKEVGLEKEKGELVERAGELGNKEEFGGIGVTGIAGGEGSAGKLGDLGCLIEERLGKVKLEGTSDCLIPVISSGNDKNVGSGTSLVGGGGDGSSGKMVSCDDNGVILGTVDCSRVDGVSGNGMKMDEAVSDEDGSSGDVESETESSSSSGSSDLPSSDSDEEEKDKNGKAEKRGEDGIDIEEGEIMLSDADEIIEWSDNEDADDNGVRGPIKSKNELEVLPPVPSVNVTLEPHHLTLPVGTIFSILGPQVIVEGVEKHNPLNEGSILWITETRSALGIVDEIFGPVKSPYYIIRYNSEFEVPTDIQQGTPISFVPEFVNHVLNDKSLYQKGYDASGENDEELLDEPEFSDDEKEAEYRRMLKMKKRGMNESKPGSKRKDKRKSNNRTRNWNRNQDPAASGDKPPISEDQHHLPPSIGKSSGLGQDMRGNKWKDKRKSDYQTGNWNRYQDPAASGDMPPVAEDQQHLVPSVETLSGLRQDMPGNQPMVPPFWPRAQAPGFPASSGIWNAGFLPLHPQSAGFPGGLPNSMQWMQQNHPFQLSQTPLPPGIAFQQQIGGFPQFPLNFGQPNFGGGPVLGPWPIPQFGLGFQAPPASLPQSGGGEQVVQQQSPTPQGSQTTFGSQDSPATSGTPPSFNQGRGGVGGGGGGRGRWQHRGRGIFGGGRGRFRGR